MLPFRPIKLSDKKDFDRIVKPLKSPLCSHSFVDLYIWKATYDTQICFKDDYVFLKQKNENDIIYTFPLGNGDLKSAIMLLREDAKERECEFYLAGVNEKQREILTTQFPGEFKFCDRRNNDDYIYSSESMITLSGKKLHSKRNFINRFTTANEGNWHYESITAENIHEVFEFHLSWCALNNITEDSEIFNETCAISLALKGFEELSLKGGLLRLNGKIIAFTLGSIAHEDMFIVHIEKADHTVSGSYQMINNQFAINNFEGIELINREEDLGKEGLRKAKLSYNPIMMGRNYAAKLMEGVVNESLCQ